MTKQILLSKGCFIDNAYLDQYVDLINKSFSFSDKDYTEQHHIIPVSFYISNYSVDRHLIEDIALADPDNKLIRLSYSDHFYVHWLLFKCTTGKVRSSSAKAILAMSGNNKVLYFSDEEIDKIKTAIKKELDYYWSAEDDDILAKGYFSGKPADEIALMCNKSVKAIKGRIARLHLSKRIWTANDIAWLTENYNSLGAEACARHLHRSLGSIEHKVNRLKISNRQWTADETKWLKENYSRFSVAELSIKLGRSKSAVYNKCKKFY